MVLIIPVEKKGTFSNSLSLRFLAFDPVTRSAYLSDKGSNVRQWKHWMRVCAVMPKSTQDGTEVNYRAWDFDAKDLLTFTVSGIAYPRLSGGASKAAREELQRLPQLLNICFQESAPLIHTAHEGRNGATASQVTRTCTAEDSSFFGKDRADWTLRCPYYDAAHRMIALMQEACIEAGLRFPLYGGLRGAIDPRNGLQLVSFPLYLRQGFQLLFGGVVYTCVHGLLIGGSAQGGVGVCVRHAYLCITDKDALFLSEGGSVVRSLPLSFVEKVEYQEPPEASTEGANFSPSSLRLMPFAAFLTRGACADVLFAPCRAFPHESDDCSASMAAAMPRMNVHTEMENVFHVLNTLHRRGERGDRNDDMAAGSPLRETAEHSERNMQRSEYTTASPTTPASPSLEFLVVTLSGPQTVQDYVTRFEDVHGRAFKWNPLPGAPHNTPTVLLAASLSQSLGVPLPVRQPVSRRVEFLPFYYGSKAAAEAMATVAKAEREAHPERHRAGSHSHHEGRSTTPSPDSELPREDVFVPTVPVRRVSKLIDMFKPSQDIY